jgi:hypothetical protein
MYYNDSKDFIDFIDIINFSLDSAFIEKWRHKYSEKFITSFQMKLLKALSDRKPIKKEALTNFFIKKLKYSNEQITNFYESIDISLYYPIIL